MGIHFKIKICFSFFRTFFVFFFILYGGDLGFTRLKICSATVPPPRRCWCAKWCAGRRRGPACIGTSFFCGCLHSRPWSCSEWRAKKSGSRAETPRGHLPPTR